MGTRNAWKEEKDREKANRVAQQVRCAVVLTGELAVQSERKVAVVCDHPPGLRDEPAEHTTAPNMGAGGSHPQAEMMQHSLSANPLLPTGNDESSMRRQLRGMTFENLRKEPSHWRTHAEMKQRHQDEEEEAWELPENTDIWSDGKRGVRAGVRAESGSNAKVLALRSLCCR